MPTRPFFPLLRRLLLLFVLNEQVCFGGLLVPIKQMCSSPFSFRLAVSQPITRGGSRILWCLKDPEGMHFSFFCVAFCLRIIFFFTNQKVVLTRHKSRGSRYWLHKKKIEHFFNFVFPFFVFQTVYF